MNNNFDRNAYHVMEIKISQISARYLLCKEWLKKKKNMVSSGDTDTEAHFATYVSRVESSFEILDESQRRIINNDFFYQNSYPFWWESFYAKSTYYRVKKAAMVAFLRNFKNA